MKDLRTYLAENKVEHLYKIFKGLGIDESQLLAKLKYSDLEKIGIENLIERRKVFDIINEINQDIYNEDIEMNKNDSYEDSLLSSDFVCKGTDRPGYRIFPGSLAEKSGAMFGSGETISQKLSLCSMPRKNSPRKSLIGLDGLDIDGSKLNTHGACNESLLTSSDTGGLGVKEEKIVVCVRKKPCSNPKMDVVDIEGRSVVVNEEKFRVDLRPYVEQYRFEFDYSFDGSQKNMDVYRGCVKSIVNHVISGGLGTILAYGQTGTGKTYTMLERDTGMMYLAIKDLMAFKSHGAVTFCEIYMGQVYDLLDNGKRVQLREVNGIVHLSNSREEKFEGYEEALEIIEKGMSLRKTGVTGANSKSSRSHAVILVNFSEHRAGNEGFQASGSIVFVDLAGSERGSDRKEMGSDVKNEGAEINKSLLALKECIRGMEKDKRHLPFRQSKLTQILKNSFIGTSKTCLIATISPTPENVEHTLNTLRYAARIKESVVPKGRRARDSLGGNGIIDQARPPPTTSRKEPEEESFEHPRLGLSRSRDVLVREIQKALSRIESKIPLLRGSEELERMLSLCIEMEDIVDHRTNKY
uniref:Kinesin-like protein n=1 Tax=Encephalitozoon cuniculi TaxID=6035 RepID=M1KI04_ENCCN|nr:kinesin-related protein [Encephalitozoon cuniculi]